MTPEEREAYLKGGPLPDHVAKELAEMPRIAGNGHVDGEIVALDYPMPHSELPYQSVSKPIEELAYPSPGSDEEEQRMNKTRRRAVQKHRAKEQKFHERKTTGQDPTTVAARPRPVAQPATSKARSQTKRRETTEETTPASSE
jgi:hypothetical protein